MGVSLFSRAFTRSFISTFPLFHEQMLTPSCAGICHACVGLFHFIERTTVTTTLMRRHLLVLKVGHIFVKSSSALMTSRKPRRGFYALTGTMKTFPNVWHSKCRYRRNPCRFILAWRLIKYKHLNFKGKQKSWFWANASIKVIKHNHL